MLLKNRYSVLKEFYGDYKTRDSYGYVFTNIFGITLVLIFGVIYAGSITLAKMGYISKKFEYIGYLFWALQTYSLYKLSIFIQSEPFTN